MFLKKHKVSYVGKSRRVGKNRGYDLEKKN
jgi:hypothetical protein